MAYVEKIEGNTCADCHTAKYVKNPRSGKIFCADKCWLKGQTILPDDASLRVWVTREEFDATLTKMREAFLRLQKQVDAHGQLLIDLRGKDAVELHESFDTPKKFDFKKAEKILQDPENFMTEHQEDNMADSLNIEVPERL